MPERTSHYTSLAERGRMEAETGMAHIYGDPDPNMGKPFHEGPGRMPYPTTGAPRTGHTSETGPGMGPTLTGQRGDVDGRTVRGGSGYGTDDRVGPSSGVQNVEQQPAIDRNTERVGPNTGGGSLSPNRGPPNTGSEVGWSSTSQAGALTPNQQRMERDFPPDLPPRPQAQLTENNQRSGQMYQ